MRMFYINNFIEFCVLCKERKILQYRRLNETDYGFLYLNIKYRMSFKESVPRLVAHAK